MTEPTTPSLAEIEGIAPEWQYRHEVEDELREEITRLKAALAKFKSIQWYDLMDAAEGGWQINGLYFKEGE